jgi:hypothetical protein
LCPPHRAQLCTYFRWLRRPVYVSLLSLVDLVNARRLRVFLRFRMGVHVLLIDVDRWRGVPRSQRTCDMCDTVLWGTSTTLCSSARLLLRLGRTMRRCLRFGSRILRAFVWLPDLLMVVRCIYDCFQVRARILNPRVGVPSNQPHLAGLM